MPPAIRVHNLGKRYTVDHERSGGYRTLRESLMGLASAPWRRLRGRSGPAHEEFWALKDVSFEVEPGEVVGIIGRNGAGKSTLLKVLSQITKPTTGRVELNGRVGSLLEVGTGFHPELTGRENIFLNGSILGMTRQEISKKFDEIVAFAEIEKFLDTPVKRYSSGMYVRLAFAVAAHLEPEILIVDEVLAVGDAAFQTKCLGTFDSIAQSGRTVILVSHNLAAIENFTQRAVVMHQGRAQFVGETQAAIDFYANTRDVPMGVDNLINLARANGLTPVIEQVVVKSSDNGDGIGIVPGGKLNISIRVRGDNLPGVVDVGIGINDNLGTRLATIGTYFSSSRALRLDGSRWIHCTTAPVNLVPGTYHLKVALSHLGEPIDEIEDAVRVVVEGGDYFRSGKMPGRWQGKLLLRSEWSTMPIGSE